MEPEVWTKEKYVEFREWLFADADRYFGVAPDDYFAYKAAEKKWEEECPWSAELMEKRLRMRDIRAERIRAREEAARELYDTLDEGGLIAFMQDEKQTEEMRVALLRAGPLPETVVNLVFERNWLREQEVALHWQRLEVRHLRRIAGDESWAEYNRVRANEVIANLHLREGSPSGRERWANRHKIVQRLLEVCGEFELAAKVREDAQKRRRAC
jgi:hypothetical protein